MASSPSRLVGRSLADVMGWSSSRSSSVATRQRVSDAGPVAPTLEPPSLMPTLESSAPEPTLTKTPPTHEVRENLAREAVAQGAPEPTIAAPELPGDFWRQHFRLSAEPFSLTPDPDFLFLSSVHAEALAGLHFGVWERRGLSVMIGEVGTGKTTLVYSLLSRLDPEIETAYLSNTLLSFDEILENALSDFGVTCPSRRRLDLQTALNRFLRACADQGKTAALVVDEAQNLSDEVFEQLRLLLNFETYKSKLLQIVLVGQPELSARLSQPNLRQIGDRVAVWCQLDPLSKLEARAYIEHRLATATGSLELFTQSALNLLIRKARGIPRRINILAHNAMLFAYGQELQRVDRATVAQAVRELRGPWAAS